VKSYIILVSSAETTACH